MPAAVFEEVAVLLVAGVILGGLAAGFSVTLRSLKFLNLN